MTGRTDSRVPVWMSHDKATPLKGILVPREATLPGAHTNADTSHLAKANKRFLF